MGVVVEESGKRERRSGVGVGLIQLLVLPVVLPVVP